MDLSPGFEVNRRYLLERYPFIKDFLRVSCKTKDGLDHLLSSIQKEVASLKITTSPWPPSWLAVKQALEQQTCPYLDRKGFRQLCEQHHVSEVDSQSVLVQCLNDLGILIHFSDFELKEFYVSDPHWVTSAMGLILADPKLVEHQGVLDLDRLESILDDDSSGYSWPTATHPYLVALMIKFEICFFLRDETLLFPSLLLKNQPDQPDFDDSEPLRYQIRYRFLPPSLMSAFIVKRHAEIESGFFWRSGALLRSSDSGTRA